MIAHAGHVVVDLVVYLGPLVAVGGALGWAAWRERKNPSQPEDS